MKMHITEFSNFFFKNLLCSGRILSGVYLTYYFKSKSFELSFSFDASGSYKFSLDGIPSLTFSVNFYSGRNEVDFSTGCYVAYYRILSPSKFSFPDFNIKFSERSIVPVWCDEADENEIREIREIGKNIISNFKLDYIKFGLMNSASYFRASYVYNLPPNSSYRGGDSYCFRYSNRTICLDIYFWVASYNFYLEFSEDFLKFLNSHLKKVNCCLCDFYEDQIFSKIRAINKLLGG